MKIKILLTVGIFVSAVAVSTAQNANSAAITDRLQTVVKSYTSGNGFMGTVLVADGDQNLLDQGYGMASLEWSIPNDPDTKFRVCSLTKQFTATLVLLLEQDGKLHIDDPVSKYMSDAPARWEKITFGNCSITPQGFPISSMTKNLMHGA